MGNDAYDVAECDQNNCLAVADGMANWSQCLRDQCVIEVGYQDVTGCQSCNGADIVDDVDEGGGCQGKKRCCCWCSAW